MNLTNKYGIIIGKLNLLLISSDIVVYYKCDKFNFVLIDEDKNPISNEKIIVNVNNKNYTVLTNDNGVATVDLDLGLGVYEIVATLIGNNQFDSVTNNSKISVLSSIIVSDMTRGYNSGIDFKAIFLNKYDNPLSNTKQRDRKSVV